MDQDQTLAVRLRQAAATLLAAAGSRFARMRAYLGRRHPVMRVALVVLWGTALVLGLLSTLR